MTYQVSRNGQMYGPYTLDDLRRYVASGNVLPTDMAKSEDMPDWLPVVQILGGTPVTAAPIYAAPPAYGQPTGIYPDPPNLNWGLELLLGFLTCGLFVVVWNLIIASWANRVQPASKALMFYIVATVLIVLNFGGSWGVLIAIAHHNPHPPHNLLGNFISIVCWVARLIARFSLRDTLEQHFNGPEPLGLRLNPVMTFFFGGIYFQYKLNEVNQIKQTLRYQNAVR
jgi:hypothetical protein